MNDVNASALDRETKLFATIERLQAENERLRAELARIKPSWDEAPEWAQWFAVDGSGAHCWYETEPAMWDEFNAWDATSAEEYGKYRLILVRPDWRETLERRPEDK